MPHEGQRKRRVAVVTGGNRGIGAAITAELVNADMLVVVGSRNSVEDLSGNPISLPLDVGDADSVRLFCEKVNGAVGTAEVLVNCAGVSTHQTVEGHDDAAWTQVIDVNLTGPFRMIRALLPGMKAAGGGTIVNIASTAARSAEPEHAAYCASKSGLLGLTRVVALEGAPHGVSCVTVSPTWVETDMLRASAAEKAAKAGNRIEEQIAAISASNLQNRLVQPEEVAALVAFLCSGRAPGLTMEDIQVNAGAHW